MINSLLEFLGQTGYIVWVCFVTGLAVVAFSIPILALMWLVYWLLELKDSRDMRKASRKGQ